MWPSFGTSDQNECLAGLNQTRESHIYEREIDYEPMDDIQVEDYLSPQDGKTFAQSSTSLSCTPVLSPASVLSSASNTPLSLGGVIRCSDCDTEFQGEYRRGNYNRHRRLYHSHQSGYPCLDPTCSKVFRRKDSRMKHHRRLHPSLGEQAPVSRRGPRQPDPGT
jgi:hypothetical protein